MDERSLRAWRLFLEIHSRVIAQLEVELRDDTGMPLSWYRCGTTSGSDVEVSRSSRLLTSARSSSTDGGHWLRRSQRPREQKSPEDRPASDRCSSSDRTVWNCFQRPPGMLNLYFSRKRTASITISMSHCSAEVRSRLCAAGDTRPLEVRSALQASACSYRRVARTAPCGS